MPRIGADSVSRLLCCMAIWLACIGSASAAPQNKPVLIMGLNYGVYERWQWVQTIFNPNQIDFVSKNDWVDPAIGNGWTPYSAVVICDSSPGTITQASNPAVLSYLNNGGKLILMESGLGSVLGGLYKAAIPAWAQPWVGAANLWAEVNTTTYSVVYTAADDVAPWPIDTIAGLTNPVLGGNWQTLKNVLPGAKSLIATPSETMMSVNHVGSNGGAVLFIGRQLFRIIGAAGTSPASIAALRQSIVETLINSGASIPGNIDLPQLRADTGVATSAYIPWRRDPEHDDAFDAYAKLGTGPRFSPLYPLASETLGSSNGISLDMGKNDYTSVSFNVFALSNISTFRILSVSGGGIPSGAIKIFSQDSLKQAGQGAADRSQTQFWLKPMVADTEISIPAGQNKVFFLTFNSAAWPDITSVKTYPLVLHLTDGTTSYSIPVTLRRYPFALAATTGPREGWYTFYPWNQDPSAFSTFTGTGFITTPFYSFDPANPSYKFYGPVLDTAAAAGFRSMNLSNIDASSVKVASGPNTGKTLKEVASGTFLNADGSVPALDFSGFDARVNSSLARGAYRVQVRNSQTDPLIKNLTGIAWTPTLDPTWKSTFIGVWGQFATYLRSKGFTELAYKFNDEMIQADIEQKWIPMSSAIAGAGWLPHLNITGNTAANNPALINEVAPIAGVIEVNATYLDAVAGFIQSGAVSIPPSTLLPIYGSWGYYKGPPIFARDQWWLIFYKGFAGIDIYNFDVDEIFTGTLSYVSGQMQGHRDGWYDNAWLQYLRDLYNNSPASPWRASVQDFLTNSIAADCSAVNSSPYFHGLCWYQIPENYGGTYPAQSQLRATSLQLEQSRHDLFQLLATPH